MDHTRAIAELLLHQFSRCRLFIYAFAALLLLAVLTAVLRLPGTALLTKITLFSPYILTCAYLVQFVSSDMPKCIQTHVLPRGVARPTILLGVAAGLLVIPFAAVWAAALTRGGVDALQNKEAAALLRAGTLGVTMTADLGLLVMLLLLPGLSGQMWLGLVTAAAPFAGEVASWMCKGNPLVPRYGFPYFLALQDGDAFWLQFGNAGGWWRPAINLGVTWLLFHALRVLYDGTDVA